MAISFKISPTVAFKVAGTVQDDNGAAVSFDFTLIARRLSDDDMQAAMADQVRSVAAFLADVCTGWRGVLDDEGNPVEFTHQALAALLNAYRGLAGVAYRAYLADAGAKAKN